MSLFAISRPFHKLSIGCATALLLLTASTRSQAKSDDFGRDFSFAFNLDGKNYDFGWDSGKSGTGKSDHDPIEFSFGNWGCPFSSGHDGFGEWGWSRDGHDGDVFVFVYVDKGWGRDHDFGGHDSGGGCTGSWTPPNQTGCGGNGNEGNNGGSGCQGGNGDPSGTGTPATPEPSVKYLSILAAGAMALLLLRRKRA